MADITELLERWHSGDGEALERLMPRVYETLRSLARRALGGGADRTLAPTVLVHEVFLKVRASEPGPFRDRRHFFAVAAVAMRHLVIDEARRRGTERRGGHRRRVDLEDDLIAVDAQWEALLDLDVALGALAHLSPRLVQVVECRYFAGLTLAETADALGVTRKTVQRDWIKAQAFLRRALENPRDRPGPG
ncbi:MAG: ECF-type sigma factor [Acidobacteriota bacterium]